MKHSNQNTKESVSILKMILTWMLLLNPVIFLYAQSIVVNKVEVDKEQKQIRVNYSLQDPPRIQFKYETFLYYSKDGMQKEVGPLKKVDGDIGKELLAYPNRLVIWNYIEEDPNFDGLNVQFKMKAKPTRLWGGPRNALYSVLVPGLGNTKVKEARWWRWGLTTFTTYALIGGSVALKNQSNKNYTLYQNGQTILEAQNLYSKANRQNTLATLLAFSAAALWATDIILVIIQGKKNMKERRRLLESEKNLRIKYQSRLNVYPAMIYPVIGIYIPFNQK